jgi:hypothetical protein
MGWELPVGEDKGSSDKFSRGLVGSIEISEDVDFHEMLVKVAAKIERAAAGGKVVGKTNDRGCIVG